jgi:hypothetical protein
MWIEVLDLEKLSSDQRFLFQRLESRSVHHRWWTIEEHLGEATEDSVLAVIALQLFGENTEWVIEYRSERMFTLRTTPPLSHIPLAMLQVAEARCSGVEQRAIITI